MATGAWEVFQQMALIIRASSRELQWTSRNAPECLCKQSDSRMEVRENGEKDAGPCEANKKDYARARARTKQKEFN